MRGMRLCVLQRACSRNIPRPGFTPAVRFYSDVPNPPTPERNDRSRGEVIKERAVTALQNASTLGKQWAHSSSQAAGATLNSWWGQYEEFVGINEVREAQTKVTQAESDFMVSRSLVREAHVNLEALQVRLKEVRERLDRVSREEPRYLELATTEHKLLQEDRRLRSTYELAESSEREKFSLFSAAVRESHEKERTRAERTKNWSIVGSVLGALIGVMGSTYVNRVRLQELKSLLLEAQKGPESLQEALRVQASDHRTQQDELGSLIGQMRLALHNFAANATKTTPTDAPPQIEPTRAASEFTSSFQSLQDGQREARKILNGLKSDLDSLRNDVSAVKPWAERREVAVKPDEAVAAAYVLREEVLVKSLEETRRNVAERLRDSAVYNAAAVYTASAITVSVLYLLLRGTSP